MTAFWQAELHRGADVYDADFPRRASSAEALRDAEERLGELTENEQRHMSIVAVEYAGDEEYAESTGRTTALHKDTTMTEHDQAANQELQDMLEMLGNHGGMFTGSNPADEAENWIDYGFTADTARPWCDIGVWDAATANAFVAASLTPEQVAAAAERMTDSLDDPGEEYTDGDPIYAACNGDLDVAKIIRATE